MSKRLMLIIMVGAFMCLPLASAWAELVHSPTEVLYYVQSATYNGATLFTPIQQNNASTGLTKTYMIDMDGRAVHFWTKNSNTETVWDARLETNGNLSRSCVLPKPAGADPTNVMMGNYGGCGAIEEVNWAGVQQWRYLAYNAQFRSHDDYLRIWNKALNQFTYLFIAWVPHTQAEAVANGATGTVPANWSLDGIYEVDYSGNIVWKWTFFEHLCQSKDVNKPNYYADVASAPQKFDINAVSTTRTAPTVDWMHCNSISYNDATGHLVINSREFNELFVIDHDGTFVDAVNYQNNFAAAASVAGDFKYRFGCPLNYNVGRKPGQITSGTSAPYPLVMTNGDINLWGAHGANFIPATFGGYTNAPAMPAGNVGNLLVFDNHGVNGQTSTYFSQVLEINPKISGYTTSATIGSSYTFQDKVPYSTTNGLGMMGSSNYNQSRQITWKFRPAQTFGLYSAHLGSAQRLPNGNTLLCAGESGHFVEVTSAASPVVVWEYANPINNGVPWKYNYNNATDGGFQVNRAYRYDLVTHPALVNNVVFSGSYTSTSGVGYTVMPLVAEGGVNGVTTLTGNKTLYPGCGGMTGANRAIPCAYTADSNGLGLNPAAPPSGSSGAANSGKRR